ncbi:MAG TPA: hypothetical protein VD886_03285 [Herpetosiphonaceae bacterium]|nr:hypothetical protein [Herpetosiphonaceae bacterium]
MKCPNCYSSVPASAAKCPRCDWVLKAPPPTGAPLFGDSPTADPWGAGPDAAPMWTPAPPTPRAWDQSPLDPVPTPDQRRDFAQLPPAGLPPGGVTPFGGARQPIPPAAAPFGGQAAPPNASLPPVTTVPLTGDQKARLLASGLLPIAVPAGMLIFFNIQLGGFFPGFLDQLPGFLYLVFGIILLVILYQAATNLRDLASGVANVQVVRLIGTRTVRNRNSVTYYAEFAQLGKYRITRQLMGSAVAGTLYRVSYSPTTKRVWTMEPQYEAAAAPPMPF